MHLFYTPENIKKMYINELCLTLKDDTTDNKRTENER